MDYADLLDKVMPNEMVKEQDLVTVYTDIVIPKKHRVAFLNHPSGRSHSSPRRTTALWKYKNRGLPD